MSIAERVRSGATGALVTEMECVSRKLKEQAPTPYSTAPSLEELQRILAGLQKRQQPRRNLFLKRTA